MEYKSINCCQNKAIKRYEDAVKGEYDSDVRETIEYWHSLFLPVYLSINADESVRNPSAICEYIERFRKGILETFYPPLEYVVNEQVLLFFLHHIISNDPIELKTSSLVIIDYLITYLKGPLVELYIPTIIEALLTISFNTDLSTDGGNYITVIGSTTKIFRTSSFYSTNFAINLLNSNFFNEFIPRFIQKFSNDIIRNFSEIDQSSIYYSFSNIFYIFRIWFQMTVPMNDNLIDILMTKFKEILLFGNKTLSHAVFNNLRIIWWGKPTIPFLMAKYGLFHLFWDFVAKGNADKLAMDLLSQGLIDESVQNHVSSIVDVNVIIQLCSNLVDLIAENKENTIEEEIEAGIVMIANKIDFLKCLPNDVELNSVLLLLQRIFENSNFSTKNCASFLFLVLMQNDKFSDLENKYPSKLLSMFFDSIEAGDNVVIGKALEVFRRFLEQARSHLCNIYQYPILAINVADFLESLLKDEESNSSGEAQKLLDEFYPDDDDDNDDEAYSMI